MSVSDYEKMVSAAIAKAVDSFHGEQTSSEEDLAHLEAMSQEQRLMAISNLRRYRRHGFCSQLLDRARSLRLTEPRLGAELSECAAGLAGSLAQVPSELRHDLQAESAAERGNFARILCEQPGAVRHLAEAEQFARLGTGEPLLAAKIKRFQAKLLLQQQEYPSALDGLRQALHLYLGVSDSRRAARVRVSMAKAYILLHRPGDALDELELAACLIDAARDPMDFFSISLVAGNALLDLGMPEGALRLCRRLDRLAGATGSKLALLRVDCLRGEALVAQDSTTEQGRRVLASVAEGFAELELSKDAAVAAAALLATWDGLGDGALLQRASAALYELLLVEGLSDEASAIAVLVCRAVEAEQFGTLADLCAALRDSLTRPQFPLSSSSFPR